MKNRWRRLKIYFGAMKNRRWAAERRPQNRRVLSACANFGVEAYGVAGYGASFLSGDFPKISVTTKSSKKRQPITT